jgi:hypothetical protein
MRLRLLAVLHSSRPGRRGAPTFPPALRLEAAVIAAVLSTGTATVLATHQPQPPMSAATVLSENRDGDDLSPPLGVVPSAPAPGAVVAAKPAAVGPRTPAVATRARATAPAKRWLPEGTGMWTYLWNRTEGGSAKRVVRRAQHTGMTHIFVRTGTRKGGFDGGPVLDQILPATRGTNIKVIAWDFPMLSNPVGEARRLARAAWYPGKGKGTPRVAAVAPDIETPAEGTRLSTAAVDTYYRELRRMLPPNVAILATVPWPSEHRIGRYPYATTARYADALLPMAYWINRDPATVTRQTMQRLKGYGKPIMPVGQAYDPRIDVPTLTARTPTHADVTAFARTAAAMGARSVSLWVWNTASPDQWKALWAARGLYRKNAPAAAAPVRPAAPASPTAPAAPGGRQDPTESATRADRRRDD